MLSSLKYLLIPKQGFSHQVKKEIKINPLKIFPAISIDQQLNSHNCYWWRTFQIIYEGEIMEGFFPSWICLLCLFFFLSPGFKHPVWSSGRSSWSWGGEQKEKRRIRTLGFRRAEFALFTDGIRPWQEEGPKKAGWYSRFSSCRHRRAPFL